MTISLGTAAMPGTFGSMTRGTVTKAWARLHHPRWAREVMGEARTAAPAAGEPTAAGSAADEANDPS